MNHREDNKRMAKNTVMLYLRMFFVMVVSLYATRVVLHVLGEEDYGIYNVVGGIVVMFSFLSQVLASASQRYFSFEIGRKNKERLCHIFNIMQILYVAIVLIILIMTEIFGLWFLYTKATIPVERMNAALWIFQLSTISFCFSLFTTPYQALIISNEKMDVYAVIGMVEASIHLFMALTLQYFSFNSDYLIIYGLMVFAKTILVNGLYVGYSVHKYEESHFHYYWDKSLAKEIISYSGWNLFGAISSVARSQGINMLINAFFNPVVNAARGIAYQVNNALNQFANNFYTAVRPQVTKNYAKGDLDASLSLVFSSSKLTYYLLMFVAIPIMVFVSPVLHLWLTEVPDKTSLFVILVVIVAMVDSVSNPLMTLAQATGRIRLYQSVVGTLILLNLPVSYIFLKLGSPVESTMYVAIVISIISLFARLLILHRIVNFPVLKYCKDVLLRMTLPTIISLLLVFGLRVFLYENNPCIWMLLASLIISVLVCILTIFLTGLKSNEKRFIIDIIQNKIRKNHVR